MKYAFIMNSGNLNPENYSAVYETEGSQYYFSAVSGMKMARELVRRLADDDFELIDLCGDFDEEKAEDLRKAAGDRTKVNYAKYKEEEQEKFNALQSTDKYGIIVLGFEAGEDLVKLELTSEEFNTYITIVGKEEMAAPAAKEMVAEGIDFIELCGYFNSEKADAIAETIGHTVPLGYCG